MTAAPEPVGGLPRIAFKIRTEGLGWIARRLAAEVNLPTTRVGRIIHAASRRGISVSAVLPRMARRLLLPPDSETRRTLFAFYDLQVAPVTFDFLWFLVGADLHRRQLGLDRIHVVIVPGPYDGLRRERPDYEVVVDAPARRERVQNILIPACALLPSYTGLTSAGSRGQAARLRSLVARHVYPADYELLLPVYPGPQEILHAARQGTRDIAVLRATAERLRDVDHWLRARAAGRRLVTITLRGYDYMPIRNSNLPAWIAFARSLDPARYFPVFIPDSEETLGRLQAELGDLVVFPEAAWNIGLRMALYERAFVNLGVNTGPMGLCWLNDRTRYATFKMVAPGVPQTSPSYFRFLGFEPDRSLPFATLTQELIWEDDTQDAIERAFARLVGRLENAGTDAASIDKRAVTH